MINSLSFSGEKSARRGPSRFAPAVLALLLLAVAGCATAVGPTRGAIENAPAEASTYGMRVIDVNGAVAQSVKTELLEGNFAANLGDASPIGTRVGVGDTLAVTIWEAAPAALFGTANLDTSVGSNVQGSTPSTLPESVVGPSGTISVPFAGEVPAAGRTLREIEEEIVARLEGRAHLPQVIVRIAQNRTANVTVLGDVNQPQRIPLTPRGERLLDAIAQAGGTGEPLNQMTIQITRGGIVQRMAASDVIRDPSQNVILQSDDVITVLYQPYSFTVLGAAGKNEEIRFEGEGISLAQALGRIGGLQDQLADPSGVFLFRWERPDLLGGMASGLQPNSEGLVPIIYQVDMKQPESFFAAQGFQMHDDDIVYVATSRVAELRRFISIISSSMLPVATVRNTVR